METIDLNADLGEGFGQWRLGDDEALLDVVTSANVACGFHAGDPSIMRRVCAAAQSRGVAIGAQVGYRDLAGFGRRRIDYDLNELRDDILYQVGALSAFCNTVAYLKPHGALYNTAATDEGQASAVVAAVLAYGQTLPVMCQPDSVLAVTAREAGLSVIAEGFADRAYLANGTLAPRSLTGAVIDDADTVVARAVRMAVAGEVEALEHSVIPCRVASICLHGDTPGAVALAARVRAGLEAAGLRLAAFS